MYKNIFTIFVFFISVPTFPQELPLKFQGFSDKGSIAVIVSNSDPVFYEIKSVISDLVKNDFRIAVVPKDYDYNITNIDPKIFAPEIKFVMKIYVYTQSPSEQQIKLKVDILRFSDKKIISEEFSFSRKNPVVLSSGIKKMFSELMPKVSLLNPKVVSVDGGVFSFAKKEFPSAKVGDEIKIRYKNSRQGKTESIAIVQKMSNDMVVAKDLSKKVEIDDDVFGAKRNRFYINFGAIFPTLGEKTLVAKLNEDIWYGSKDWSAGFKMEGEFERFIPYQLVSTTAFGMNVDRNINIYIMTGIGYRGIVDTWEFVPYFRLGVMYRSIAMTSQDTGNLQGFSLNFGMMLGLNIVKRLDNDFFVGTDIGFQYFPFSSVSVLTDSEKVEPQWQKDKEFTDDFSATKMYPYIGVKVGWIF